MDKPAPGLRSPHQPRVRGFMPGWISSIWLIPLVAALVGGWLVWRHYSEVGPVIIITFATAEGLEAGKTKVKFKDVDIGRVESISLAQDHSHVLAHTRMDASMAERLTEGSRFWVERPRIRGTNVEGLSTLLSGAYIAMDMGPPGGRRLDRFTGLEKPPVFSSETPGRRFVLEAETLGSVAVGSPVFYRQVEVGQVTRYAMDELGKGIQVDIFVFSPYDRYINSQTRFWEASGFDVQLDASGVRLDTQSLNSLLSGGVAFQNHADASPAREVSEGAGFRLYKDRKSALSFDQQETATFALRFDQTLRGLTPGAAVDMLGLEVGRVRDILPMYDDQRQVVYMMVHVDLFISQMKRIGTAMKTKRETGRGGLDSLVQGGLRAQLRTGNLVTGQMYVSLDFVRNAPMAKVDWKQQPPLFPTVAGTLANMEESVSEIMAKIRKLPLDRLRGEMEASLRALTTTLGAVEAVAVRLDQDLAPEAKATLVELKSTLMRMDRTLASAEQSLAPDGPLAGQVSHTLMELERTAATIRNLSDSLELRPESLLRGKEMEAIP